MGAILIQATTEAVLWTNSMASSTWECVRTAALSQDLGVPIIPKYSAPPSPFPVLGARPPSINASGVGEENSGVVALVSYHTVLKRMVGWRWGSFTGRSQKQGRRLWESF